MDDTKIINLYWERSELAIDETSNKYSNYCYVISFNILRNNEDAEECVNDTYLRAWDAIPPKRPNNLKTFLGKITRNLSLNKYKHRSAVKRGNGQIELALSELEACIPSSNNVDNEVDKILLVETINNFLATLSQEKQRVFVRRYWYISSIRDIAMDYGMTESKVKSMLFRMRYQLKVELEKEDIFL